MRRSVSINFLSWNVSFPSSLVVSTSDWKRPYDYWQHADRLLTEGADDHYRIDCIGNLKRALDHRLKRLAYLYRFKQIPDPGKPAELLDMLGYFGVARPAMLREVTEIRNLLEHQYKRPPPLGRCRELVDFAWYFLRSTDSLSTYVSDSLNFGLGDDAFDYTYWLELKYGPEEDWKCSLRGWLPNELVAEDQVLPITLIDASVETPEQFLERNPQAAGAQGREVSDVYLSGVVVGPPKVLTQLTTIYFSIL